MKNKIFHHWFLVDSSGSMSSHLYTVPKVMDAHIRALSEDSKNHPGEETRVSIFMFSSPGRGHVDYECLLYDVDALNVPSISGKYRIAGGTALCDSVVKIIGDMKLVTEKYGEHFHLLHVISDGEELHSTPQGRRDMPSLVAYAPKNYTIAAFTPSAQGKHFLMRYGFPPGNISVWDPTQEHAVEEVGVAMAAATTSYYASTRSGTATSVQNLYEMKAPSASDLKKTLTPLTAGSYYFEHVDASDLAKIEKSRLDQFIELKTGKPYFAGRTYYEMTQRVRIQPDKKIMLAIVDKSTNTEDVYTGPEVREKLGLPNDGKTEVRISPGKWNAKGYKVYVQSRSNNRKLIPGTRVLVMR